MIASYSLFTSEADAPELALADILAQLDEVKLLQNAVGIVACHYDFVRNGVTDRLMEALPFPLIGTTTFYQASSKVSGYFELTITVLTSDDVRFALSESDTVASQTPREKIHATYRSAFDQYGEKPACMFTFFSANRPVSGDEALRMLDEVSGTVPTIGIVSSGDDESGTDIYVLCGKRTLVDGLAVLLLIGEVEAAMYSTGAEEERLLEMTATVTKSSGVFVEELNDQPARTYLRKHGLMLDDTDKELAVTIPCFCRFPDEEAWVGRSMWSFEGDTLQFLAEVPEGTLFRLGTVTADDILQESRALVERALAENPRAVALFMGSCVGRFITLGLDTTSEMDYALETVPEQVCHLACYVGGEIAPSKRDGVLSNRYRNNSVILCVLS